MNSRAPRRNALAALLALALLAGPAAGFSAPCCAPPAGAPAETSLGAPGCCGCDGLVSRAVPVADAAASPAPRVALAIVALVRSDAGVPMTRTLARGRAAEAARPGGPPAPSPRRL